MTILHDLSVSRYKSISRLAFCRNKKHTHIRALTHLWKGMVMTWKDGIPMTERRSTVALQLVVEYGGQLSCSFCQRVLEKVTWQKVIIVNQMALVR